MAPSNVSNCRGGMIQFSFNAKSKLSLPMMVFLLTLASAQSDNPSHLRSFSCGGNDIVNGSALERNLKAVLNSLVDNVNETGYNFSWWGENGDKIYGMAQCRGDLNASTCRTCVSNAIKSLREDCPHFSTGIFHLNGCFVKVSTDNFYSKYDASGINCEYDLNEYVGDWERYPSIAGILRKLIDDAVSSNVGFSTRNGSGIYALAQCRGDLSMNQCRDYLHSGFHVLRTGGNISSRWVYNEGFIIRYARHKFYGDAVVLPSPPTGPSGPAKLLSNGSFIATNGLSRPRKGKRYRNLPLILGLTIPGSAILMVLMAVIGIWKSKVTKPLSTKPPLPDGKLSTAISKSKVNYKFRTLQSATNNFNPTNKIGQGGFGAVYKGVLPNGSEIVVKRLFSNREQSGSDFFNEVNLISCVQHKNLVKLLGCSVDGSHKLLVYEYLPNKSLDQFLFDENTSNVLHWERRFEIILGIVGGLTYLHQESDIRIIHRDIKASNILLDQHFKPKIADFGLVRYFAENETHLSTTVVGTRGYMAPEYVMHGHLTEKVDVYAFGVLVLEIISGRKNNTPNQVNDMRSHMPSLLTVVWNHYMSGTLSKIIDPNIEENCKDEVLHVVHVALLCTQFCAKLRPSMSKVVMFLTSKDSHLPTATQPPFIDVDHSQSNTNTIPASNHSQAYTNIRAAVSLNTISTSSFGPR